MCSVLNYGQTWSIKHAGPTKDKSTDAPNEGIIKSSFKGWEIVCEGVQGIFGLLSPFQLHRAVLSSAH